MMLRLRLDVVHKAVINLSVLLNDITDAQPDTQQDALIERQRIIHGQHCLLNGHRTVNGADGVGEFRDKTLADRAHAPA